MEGHTHFKARALLLFFWPAAQVLYLQANRLRRIENLDWLPRRASPSRWIFSSLGEKGQERRRDTGNYFFRCPATGCSWRFFGLDWCLEFGVEALALVENKWVSGTPSQTTQPPGPKPSTKRKLKPWLMWGGRQGGFLGFQTIPGALNEKLRSSLVCYSRGRDERG